MPHNQEGRQKIETNPKMTQMIKLHKRIKHIYFFNFPLFKNVEKSMEMMRTEVKDIKKTQIKPLKMKNIL